MQLSVVIITFNEEANIGRTLASLKPFLYDMRGEPAGSEIIVLDSGSNDRTVEIARSLGATVYIEEWKGYAAQKNSAIEKASGRWIFSLDADEEVSPELSSDVSRAIAKQGLLRLEHPPDSPVFVNGFSMPRKNMFLGRWIKYGGFWPDRKMRLFRKGTGRFNIRPVHETAQVEGKTADLTAPLLHHSYPTLSDYIDHMNRYSSLGAEMVAKGKVRFSFINIILRPLFTFIYNYFLRLGFLDGREGLLLHLYHSVYVSWKYSKAWELSRKRQTSEAPGK
ncbi:MAG TPA: glycosyltransferase family 2 protein [Candidatus Sulfotelmatobacter sp.]|nr:glycosyltransferase family 2 protein [Candidatus Sulfotelmatobacter sp.]